MAAFILVGQKENAHIIVLDIIGQSAAIQNPFFFYFLPRSNFFVVMKWPQNDILTQHNQYFSSGKK